MKTFKGSYGFLEKTGGDMDINKISGGYMHFPFYYGPSPTHLQHIPRPFQKPQFEFQTDPTPQERKNEKMMDSSEGGDFEFPEWEPMDEAELDAIEAMALSLSASKRSKNGSPTVDQESKPRRRLPGWSTPTDSRETPRQAFDADVDKTSPNNGPSNWVPSPCNVMNKLRYPLMRFGGRIFYSRTIDEVAGVFIHNDARRILKDYDVPVRGLEDLSSLANIKLGVCRNWSLASLVEQLAAMQLDKDRKIRTGNWETPCLSEKQLLYAATDAFASWIIHEYLSSLDDAINSEGAITPSGLESGYLPSAKSEVSANDCKSQ
ncbi:Werner Syndrome-like exonuclease [Acorus gramineus]|uniref:3'-5' exonuclease n=1 Tax=Acorus gramineus TaxID=55184 RepID=A0AAV9ARN5_ACOGR|nr:Werner Syndrome-like exonuclease [Acorus gramineus]